MAQENYIQQLVNYLKRNLSKGYTIESLKWALINQGYSRSSVNKAIQLTNEQLALKAPKLKEKPIIKYEIVTDKEEKKKIKRKTFWEKIKELFW